MRILCLSNNIVMKQHSKIRLGLINFTNCLPLNYTLEQWQPAGIELIYGNPAQINSLMAAGELDAAPVSSVEYLKNEDKYKLIETACISSDGECGSVILFSDKEFEKIRKVALPNDSATSVVMLKIFMKNHDIIYSKHDYHNINPDIDAALFIGDNALIEKNNCNKYRFAYDLGEMWKRTNNLPAVFGTWVKKEGINHLDDLIAEAIETGLGLYFNQIISTASAKLNLLEEIIVDYLTLKISYQFTERHIKSLEKFKESCNVCFSGYNSSGYNRL